jgi:hypothetical protein
MNRGQFLLRVSFVVTLIAGSMAVCLLKVFTTMSPIAIFVVAGLIGVVAFVTFVAMVSKMGC